MFKSSKYQRFKGKSKWNIWQLFRATNFESLMYPCFTFCRILGIFPYKINVSTIKIYKPYYILSTIIICVFCVCELISLYKINVSKNIMYLNEPKKFQNNCFFIFGGFITIFTFILCKPRMRLIQTILELSLKLPPESYQDLSRLIHAKDIFGFFIIVLSIFLEESILYFRVQYDILQEIFALYIVLLVFQMDMLYVNCVCVLKACFKQINDNVANLGKCVVNDKPYIRKRTYCKEKNLFLLMKLKALEKQHLMISDTVQMLNMIFSLQLLATITITFVEVTFVLYFYIIQWKIDVLVNYLNNQIYDLFLLLLMIYYSIKMIMIVWACETGKTQATEINTTVHNLLNNTSDKHIKCELQLFSLQLMHHKNVFSAKGLIVDATLLTDVNKRLFVTLNVIMFHFILCSCFSDGGWNYQIFIYLDTIFIHDKLLW
ncbi:putative gustatory receptor 28a [Monomorium pharaonis]|uniref:putative gustatory receptor 28a n=1 Tax=Monomorium pharaonis TaxID=307658 RepID=UPI0017472704|nr:putative gustatory receptor 28a [Monomorium pharaonis]